MVRELLFQVLFIESQYLHFCLCLRFSNRTTLRSMYYKKTISKLRNYNWKLRRECVDWWRDSGYACKGNSTICLVDVAIVIILVSYFICLMSIATFFALVIFIFPLLLLKRALTLQLLLLLEVLSPLRRFIPIWDARIVNSISGISLPRKFCLNSRIYNIPNKIWDICIEEKDRDRNKVS